MKIQLIDHIVHQRQKENVNQAVVLHVKLPQMCQNKNKKKTWYSQ